VLGMVREYQKNVYKRAFSMIDLDVSPNLEKIAEAYDMPFLRISSMDNIESKIDTFLENEECYLVECIVDPEVNSK
jgi:acetolactate synthase-1/2/3 large subunit